MSNEKSNSYYFPLVTLTTLFFMWGFITCLNDILIPYLKDVFELTHFQSNLVQLAFFLAYFIVSLLYFIVSALFGDPIMKIGYKNTIVLGLVISAIACFLFFLEASSESPAFSQFLLALFLLGSGFTFLQIAANPLVAVLGTPETSSSRLNLSQAFNSLGTTLAPIIGGYFIFEYFDAGTQGATEVQIPYLFLTSVLLILAGVIFMADIPNVQPGVDAEVGNIKAGALKYPHLVFGMFAIFCYVGAEVAIGSNLVGYMGGSHGIAKETASQLLSFYWGGAMIGRFMGALSMSQLPTFRKRILMVLVAVVTFLLIIFITYEKLSASIDYRGYLYYLGFLVLNYFMFILAKSKPSITLGIFAIVNICLIVAMLLFNKEFSLWCILSVGLFNSIMFSNVFTLAIDGLGKYTSQGSSLLVMMILGGAVLPPLQGMVADHFGVQMAFFIPMICYAYLVWYGFIGCNIRKDKSC